MRIFRRHHRNRYNRPRLGQRWSAELNVRSPPSEGDWTCRTGAYRYIIDEHSDSGDPWEKCFNVVDKSDEDLCRNLKDEIEALLIVASLFLAIVTAFTIESFKWLRVDQEEAMVDRLDIVVRLLNDSSARGTARPPPQFEPNHSDVVVNQLWFLSMTLSLSAVVVGTLCLQWLSAFRRTDTTQTAYDDALALRQLRYEGLVGWAVPRVPAILLLTVQGALVLFVIGLLYFLWSINRQVAVPIAIVSGVSVVLLTLTTVMPLLQAAIGTIAPATLVFPQCPYKSPASWVIHRFCLLLGIAGSYPLGCIPRIRTTVSTWRGHRVRLLTDWVWQYYDELWRRQRESWGPQSSKTGAANYSYYLVRGLSSAVEKLVFQKTSVHTIQACLRDFHGTEAEVETFEDLLQKDFTPAEEALLKNKVSNVVAHSAIAVDLRSLRRDFMNAHALQHFVTQNKQLHRTLLPHRLELYVRIKNSSRGLEITPSDAPTAERKRPRQPIEYGGYEDKEERYIGSSIECPVLELDDAMSLKPELRYQLLHCVYRLLGTDQCRNTDALGAILALKAVKSERFSTHDELRGNGGYESITRQSAKSAPETHTREPHDQRCCCCCTLRKQPTSVANGIKEDTLTPLPADLHEKLGHHYPEPHEKYFGKEPSREEVYPEKAGDESVVLGFPQGDDSV